MFVTLSLTLSEDADALTIPEVAVQRGQSGDYVFVITEGKASKRDITVSRLQGGLAVVATGIAAGEQVAVDGMLSLKDGAPVRVVDDAATVPASTP
jgi:multidrug efflux system membrane fusion protein